METPPSLRSRPGLLWYITFFPNYGIMVCSTYCTIFSVSSCLDYFFGFVASGMQRYELFRSMVRRCGRWVWMCLSTAGFGISGRTTKDVRDTRRINVARETPGVPSFVTRRLSTLWALLSSRAMYTVSGTLFMQLRHSRVFG